MLQVGTNSLRSSTSARECAEGIVNLAHMRSDESSAQLSISSLVSGVDEKALGVKVSGVNKTLRKFCNQNDGGYVDHSNIADHDLNRSSLHLNAKGTARLASNFIKFLKLRGDYNTFEWESDEGMLSREPCKYTFSKGKPSKFLNSFGRGFVMASLKVFRYSFRRPYRYFSIALKGILSLSDRYKIFASD